MQDRTVKSKFSLDGSHRLKISNDFLTVCYTILLQQKSENFSLKFFPRLKVLETLVLSDVIKGCVSSSLRSGLVIHSILETPSFNFD